MRKIVLTLSARRALSARTHAARVRYAQIYSRGPAVVLTLPTPVAHETSVTPVEGGLFVPSCACGGLKSHPMSNASAKGVATRHRNAKTPATVAA